MKYDVFLKKVPANLRASSCGNTDGASVILIDWALRVWQMVLSVFFKDKNILFIWVFDRLNFELL